VNAAHAISALSLTLFAQWIADVTLLLRMVLKKNNMVTRMWSKCALVANAIMLIMLHLATSAAAAPPREIIGWFVQAQALERANRPLDAAAYYRRVWQAAPTRSDAVLRGTRLLAENGRFEEAVAWLGEATAETPGDPVLWVEFGDVFDRAGYAVQADSVWRIGSSSSSDPVAFHIGVADRLVSRGQLRRAQTWLRACDARGDGQRAVNRRLLDIALALGDGQTAAQAASGFVAGDVDRVREARDIIQGASLTPATMQTVTRAAVALSDSIPRDAARALLAAEMAVLGTRQEDAVRLFLRSAKETRNPGTTLATIIDELEARGQTPVATSLMGRLASDYPESPSAQRYAFTAAERLGEMGFQDRARNLLSWIITIPFSPYHDDARIALGEIFLALDSVEQAEQQFSWAATRGRTPAHRRQGILGQGECALRSGRLDEAQSFWQMLADSAMREPESLKAHLRLAQAAMFRGDAPGLRARCELMVGNAAPGDETNDCLRLAEILEQAGDDSAAWVRYGRLEFLFATGHRDSVLFLAPRLFGTPLEGWVRLLVAEVEINEGHYSLAATTLKAAASLLDSSSAGEEALWRYAELQRTRLQDSGEETRALETLLTTYPRSVYGNPARRRLRELRAEPGAL